MSAQEHHLKDEHFRAWLEEQTRRSLEQTEGRAALADAQRRLDDLERRMCALNGPPMLRAGQ